MPLPAPDDEALPALTAHYLTEVKRSDGLPLDPVARFHLGNGAIVHDVHANADTSPKGLQQSGGAMVNYLYDLALVEQNHENFVTTHEVPATQEVRDLAGPVALATDEEG